MRATEPGGPANGIIAGGRRKTMEAKGKATLTGNGMGNLEMPVYGRAARVPRDTAAGARFHEVMRGLERAKRVAV